MARELADRRGVTMTDVIVDALQRQLREERAAMPVAGHLLAIGKASAAKARPGGHEPARDEMDGMWTR